jgi:hypothetical protein
LLTVTSFESLAGLYAIGVVGAITVNLGSCAMNRTIGFTWYDRVLFGITFVILLWVELTLAHTKPDALFFVMCILGAGLALRAYTQKRQGLTTMTVTHQVAAMVSPDLVATMQPRMQEGQKIMVAARGITSVLSFALDEAQLRKATLPYPSAGRRLTLYLVFFSIQYCGPSTSPQGLRQTRPDMNEPLTLIDKFGTTNLGYTAGNTSDPDTPAAAIATPTTSCSCSIMPLGGSPTRRHSNARRSFSSSRSGSAGCERATQPPNERFRRRHKIRRRRCRLRSPSRGVAAQLRTHLLAEY